MVKAIVTGTMDGDDADGVIYLLADITFAEYEERVKAHYLYAKKVYEEFPARPDLAREVLRKNWRETVLDFVTKCGYKMDDWVRL